MLRFFGSETEPSHLLAARVEFYGVQSLVTEKEGFNIPK